MKPRLRTALIGFGKMAAGYSLDPVMTRWYEYASHSQVLREHPAFAWDAVIDPSPEAQALARDIWSIPNVFDSAEAAAAAGYAPDCLIIATPPDLRAGALEPFGSVKVALVEKPLGRSLDEALNLVELAARKNILLQVNTWRRADETMQNLANGGIKELIGNVQAASFIYGNGLHNNGFHLIDMVEMLLGAITSVQALGEPRPGPHLPLPGDFDLTFALHLQSGLIVLAQPLDFQFYRENGLDLWGSDGRLTVTQEGLCLNQYPRTPHRATQGAFEVSSDAPSRLPRTVGQALWRMYDNLAESVTDPTRACSPVEGALLAERILAALEQSIEQRGERIEVLRQ